MSDTAAAYRINGQRVERAAFYAVACDPARSVAVEACAGAGKTWMLVSRILRALLDGTAPQDILAITFTKKAAGEMRQRLQDWLREFAALDEPRLTQELVLRGMSPSQAQARAADLRGLHARLLAAGRPVQIRTFHSWFASLLRSAPLAVLQELNLPAEHELLEDDAPAVALVWPRFFAAVAADPVGRQDFLDSVARHGRHQTLKALAHALGKRVEFALADEQGIVDASVQPLEQVYPELAGHTDPAQALLGEHRALLLAAAACLGRASAPTFSARGVELETALTEGRPDDALGALLTQKNEPRKFSDKLVGIKAVRDAQALCQRVLAARVQAQAWQHQQRMARLTRALLAVFAQLKRERGWVDMNDVEGAARRLLADAELSGWLQQRLDARVRQLLIDEFQDTNPLQWQALYGWLSAYAGAGPGEAPAVFLVGDPKQSIYRFRRAEPQVFKAAQAFVVQGLGGALLSCDHTRRCATGVVETLNTVMLAAQADGDTGFRAHTTESREAGAVLRLPQVLRPGRATDDDGLVPEEPGWRDSLTTPRTEPEDSLSAQEARQAADWLAAQLASGACSPEAVMVLSRKRERLGWLHQALAERGIPCEQPEKQDLCEVPAVQDLVALLDGLVSPTHNLSLARALRSPVFGLGDADLARVARLCRRAEAGHDAQGETTWWGVLQTVAPEGTDDPEADARLQAVGQRLRRWQTLLASLPPHDALAEIYREGDVLARYAAAAPPRQREPMLAALRALLAHSLAQDGGRYLTAYRLVRALKAGGIPLPTATQTQAVRLLTIHGAKGLEAHTVLMLDTDAAPSRPESMGVLVDWPGEQERPSRFVFLASEKQPPACAQALLEAEQRARALEELNALYVALTRAEARVVISSVEPHQRGSVPSWWQRLAPHATAEPAASPWAPPAQAGGMTPEVEGVRLRTLPTVPQTTPPPSSTAASFGTPGASVSALSPEPDPEAQSRTAVGLALHRLLQWLPTPRAGFTWQALHQQAVAREFGLTSAQAEQALHMAQAMLQGEAAWVWDAAQLSFWGNEVELWHQGQALRLDRLVRRADTGCWWVLDFKSALHPERQAELRAQLQRYHRALALAHPGDAVRLAFINARGQLIEIPAEPLLP